MHNSHSFSRRSPIVAAIVLNLAALMPASSHTGPIAISPAQEYNGWKDAVVMSNGLVEVVVVPSIGRVMQFRFAGETDGPFWENCALAGKHVANTSPWNVSQGSYGGDKSWPAPQTAWGWPPPEAFDNSACAVETLPDSSLLLTSPVCAKSGVQVLRKITLEPDGASMSIQTTYKKVRGEPVEFAIWIITQTKAPLALYLNAPETSLFEGACSIQIGEPSEHLTRKPGLLRLTRDLKQNLKIGNDGTRLVLVGETELLRMDIARRAGTYADGGCSIEVYTNAGPAAYVEMETLGPLNSLNAGDEASDTTTYTLAHRSGCEADDVAAQFQTLAK
ncbi:MAG: hypothetical protein WC360_02310 [Opitutales bacterium]|jgi:hypothetical protein